MATAIPEESLAPIFHVGTVVEDKKLGYGVVVGTHCYDDKTLDPIEILWIFFPKRPDDIAVTDSKKVKQVRVDKTPRRINQIALALMKADKFQTDPDKFFKGEEL